MDANLPGAASVWIRSFAHKGTQRVKSTHRYTHTLHIKHRQANSYKFQRLDHKDIDRSLIQKAKTFVHLSTRGAGDRQMERGRQSQKAERRCVKREQVRHPCGRHGTKRTGRPPARWRTLAVAAAMIPGSGRARLAGVGAGTGRGALVPVLYAGQTCVQPPIMLALPSSRLVVRSF